MRAFIFPGQGSQAVGMGKALAEASPTARAVFEEIDEALGQHLFGERIDAHRECATRDHGKLNCNLARAGN